MARVLLFKEHWCTPAPSATSTASPIKLLPPHCFDKACIELPRPKPEQLTGAWSVFTVAATPIQEENPNTGDTDDVWLYHSLQERQEWQVTDMATAATSSNGGKTAVQGVPDSDEGSGGTYWLPGNCVITFRMEDTASANINKNDATYMTDGQTVSSSTSQASASSNGNGKHAAVLATTPQMLSAGTAAAVPRGFVMSFGWVVEEGTVMFIERQYDGQGCLMEVRQGTAVKGGYNGGQM